MLERETRDLTENTLVLEFVPFDLYLFGMWQYVIGSFYLEIGWHNRNLYIHERSLLALEIHTEKMFRESVCGGVFTGLRAPLSFRKRMGFF